MPSYLVASVQHTGTHLIAKMFDLKWAAIKEETQGNRLHLGHISTGQLPHIMRVGLTMPVIVPIRHPYLVEESWRRRNKQLPEMYYNYQQLIDKVDTLSPFYISIDTDKRDDQLKALNDSLNLNLLNDWSVKNSFHATSGLDVKELKPSKEVEAFFKDNQEFFAKFY